MRKILFTIIYRLFRFIRLSIIVISLIISYFLAKDFHTEETIVAVIDSGLNTDHEMIRGRHLEGYDFIDFDSTPQDETGHGTHVSGIILSNAPEVKILPIRSINSRDRKSINLSIPIIYAVMKGADIINLSLHETCNPYTKWATTYSQYKGVIIVAATGNEGEDIVNCPASYEGVYGVGGYNEKSFSFYQSSNYGEETDFIAPSVDILSADSKGSVTTKSGTSMSTAHLSGIIGSLLIENPNMENITIYKYLYSISNTIDYENKRFNAVSKEKISSLQSENPYIWIKTPTYYQKERNICIPYEVYNITHLRIYRNNILIKNYQINKNKECLSIWLTNGTNLIEIRNNDNEVITDFTLIFDNTPPKIDTSFLSFDDKNYLIIRVKENHLSSLKINGIEKEHNLNDYDRGFAIFLIPIDNQNFITIEVIDLSGNITELKINTIHLY